MRRPSSIETFTPSAAVSLHPALIMALDNLDVQLEEELARYRRRRQLPPDLSRTPWLKSKSAVQLPQPRLGDPLPEPAQQQVQRMLALQQAAGPAATAVAASAAAGVGSGPWESAASAATMPPVEVPPRETASPQTPEPPVSHPPVAATAAVPAAMRPPAAAPGIAPYAHPDLAAYEPSAAIQKFVHHPPTAEAPDGYLDSSEELLRSIAEEAGELRADPEPNRLLDTLLSPMGIGSMLLLLLSSVTLGYVIMNPTSLRMGLPSTSNEQGNRRTPAPTDGDSQTQTSIPAEGTPSPNLAAEEFVDLNLDNLGTLPRPGNSRAPQPIPKSPANSAASSTSGTQPAQRSEATNRTATAPPVYSLPEVAPAMPAITVPSQPAVSTPAPAPAVPPAVAPEPVAPLPPLPEVPEVSPPSAAASEPSSRAAVSPEPAATAPAAAAPDRNYIYVMTDYSGDPSLQQARTAVPDAYVRNLPAEGAKVQLGAFSEEEKAQELLQDLQQQGIPAEIYRP